MKSDERFLIETKLSIARLTTDSAVRERMLFEIIDLLKPEDIKKDIVFNFLKSLADAKYNRSLLYEKYLHYCEKVFCEPLSRQAFYKKASEYGFVKLSRNSLGRYVEIKKGD